MRTRSGEDLDRAVGLLRSASSTEHGPNAPGAQQDLGNVLWIRYGRSRRLDDLDEALAALRRAESAMPLTSTDRPGCLNSLAVALAERFGREGRAADLSECVAVLRQAMGTATPDGPDRQVIAVNLGNALRVQALMTSSASARGEAITRLRTALNDAERLGTARASAAYNLANALLTEIGTPVTLVEADEAAALIREAVSLVGEGGVDGPRFRAGLGRALHRRYRTHSDAPGDLDEGLAAFGAAATIALDIDLELALGAARNWAGWAREAAGPGAAEPGYRVALAAARRLFSEQVTAQHKRTWMRAAAGLHAEAAHYFATAARQTDRYAAVAALEAGRALLLADELGLRPADLDRLDGEDPELIRRYRRAVEVLSATTANAEGRIARLPLTEVGT